VTARQLAKRIAVITTLPRSIVPLESCTPLWLCGEGAGHRLQCRVLDLEKPARRAENWKPRLHRHWTRAGAIVLGCAGMADLAQKLSEKFDVPVVDGVAAAVKQAEALAGLKLRTSRRGAYAFPSRRPMPGCWKNLRRHHRTGLNSSLRANGSRECAPDDRRQRSNPLKTSQNSGLLRRFAPRKTAGAITLIVARHRSVRKRRMPEIQRSRLAACAACIPAPAGETNQKTLSLHRVDHHARHFGRLQNAVDPAALGPGVVMPVCTDCGHSTETRMPLSPY